MNKKSIFLLILGLVFFLVQCGTEDRKIRLRLKFGEGQKLEWLREGKAFVQFHENDSLIKSYNQIHKSEMFEEVVGIIDSTTARLKITINNAASAPDSLDSSNLTIFDTLNIEFIQTNRGVNIDIVPDDTTHPEWLEYEKKTQEQLACRYPDEPVSTGYTWTNSVKVMLKDGDIRDAVSTYKVKEFVKEAGYDCVIIEYTTNTIAPLSGRNYTHKNQEVQESFIERRKVEGSSYFAYKKGFVVRDSYSYTLYRDINYIVDGKERNVQMTSKGSSGYSLIDASGI